VVLQAFGEMPVTRSHRHGGDFLNEFRGGRPGQRLAQPVGGDENRKSIAPGGCPRFTVP